MTLAMMGVRDVDVGMSVAKRQVCVRMRMFSIHTARARGNKAFEFQERMSTCPLC